MRSNLNRKTVKNRVFESLVSKCESAANYTTDAAVKQIHVDNKRGRRVGGNGVETGRLESPRRPAKAMDYPSLRPFFLSGFRPPPPDWKLWDCQNG